jgi:hypothetical protein
MSVCLGGLVLAHIPEYRVRRWHASGFIVRLGNGAMLAREIDGAQNKANFGAPRLSG